MQIYLHLSQTWEVWSETLVLKQNPIQTQSWTRFYPFRLKFGPRLKTDASVLANIKQPSLFNQWASNQWLNNDENLWNIIKMLQWYNYTHTLSFYLTRLLFLIYSEVGRTTVSPEKEPLRIICAVFTDQMSFLSPSQQCQEGHCLISQSRLMKYNFSGNSLHWYNSHKNTLKN